MDSTLVNTLTQLLALKTFCVVIGYTRSSAKSDHFEDTIVLCKGVLGDKTFYWSLCGLFS